MTDHEHDFKLVDGEEVCECGLIKPLETPEVQEVQSKKRKNISISEEIWTAWIGRKGSMSWNMLLMRLLTLDDEVKELKELIRVALVSKPVPIIVQQQMIPSRQLSQIPSAHEKQTLSVPTPKNRPEFIKELRALTEKYDNIKDVLKDVDEERANDGEIDKDKLEKAQREAEERSNERRKKWALSNLSTPS
jgi:hypothetical protein